jgi:four helix bundle protein
VAARSFGELDCWQLANELKRGIYELIRRDVVRRDLEFCNRIRNSAASTPRNIAEGFGQYLRIANGSLMETSNHIEDGRDRGYFSPAEIEPLIVLARRASAAVTKLIRYLQERRTHERTDEPPMDPCTQEPLHA